MSEEMEIIKSLTAALEKKMEIISDKEMEIEKYKLMEIELMERKAEIEQYKAMIMEQTKTNSDDWFLAYSNDFNDQSTKIICQNLVEFGELAYNHGQQLIARQECNLAFCIYLAPFKGNSNLSETIDAIEDLIEKKILEEDEKEHLPVGRIVPQMKLMANKLDKLEQVVTEKEKLRIGTLDSRFHAPKYLDQAIKSPIFIEKLCQYLSEDHTDSDDSDDEDLPPPFANMTSLTEKKKHLMDFLKYLKANVNGDIEKTPMQTTLTKCMANVEIDFVDLRDSDQMEKTKEDFKTKYGLEDTIGTIHVYFDRNEGKYEYSVVINGWGYRKGECGIKKHILKSIYDHFDGMDWPNGGKLATDLDVPDHLSNFFVHTTNKDVFTVDKDEFRIIMEMNDAQFRFINTIDDSLSLYKIDELFMGFLHGKI